MSVLNIALTGHRPHRLDGYDTTTPYYARLENHLTAFVEVCLNHVDEVVLHSGMALGADSVWSRAALALRKKFGERVKFVAHVPFPTQPTKWRHADQEFWKMCVDAANEVVTYGQGYSPRLLHKRNEGMVDRADILLAVWDGGTSGGTYGAVQYAQRTNRCRIQRIDPDQFKN